MTYNLDDPKSWPVFKPLLIAHDVGRSRDRSTAVVGGNSPYGQRVLGIVEAEELPQQLFGHARASALAAVDRRYDRNALIVADLSYDPTYGEVLFETFGARVIGLQISRYGDGMSFTASGGATSSSSCRARWKRIESDWLRRPRSVARLNSWSISRRSFVTTARSTLVRQGGTMT